MVFLNYADKTGIVGAVGTVLGKAGVDIQQMAVSVNGSGKALMVLLVGKAIDSKLVDELAKAIDGTAKFVAVN